VGADEDHHLERLIDQAASHLRYRDESEHRSCFLKPIAHFSKDSLDPV